MRTSLNMQHVFRFCVTYEKNLINQINQPTMGPWDHYSYNELFSDLSEAHIHAVLHLKERDCLYKQFWREHKMSTFCEVLHPFSTEGFETLENA